MIAPVDEPHPKHATASITPPGTASHIAGETPPASAPPRAVAIPERIGSVTLLRELGRGGMGVVWLGRDDMLNREVAVKFLLQAVSTADDPQFSQFLEGARAAAAVHHPGLTVLHHADLHDGLPYLVMEYVDGVPLSRILQDGRTLEPALALAIIRKTTEAVAELHDRGIVHRDIKPANILIDRNGRIVVTDFGLACDRVPVGAALSKRVAGTPLYMAPEMFQGQISPRSDVYALGATLLEMLAGQDMVHDSTHFPQQVAHQLQERQIEPPLIDLIERAMNRNSMYRLKTARQFLNALPMELGGRKIHDHDLAALVTPGLMSSRREDHRSDSSQFASLSDLAEQRRQRTDFAPADLESRPAPEQAMLPGSVGFDLPCIKCHYNLRATQLEGVCPDCGTPVGRSANLGRLHYAPRSWLRRLKLACTIGRVAIWISLACLAVILFYDDSTVIDVVSTVALLGLFGVAGWMVTTARPGAPYGPLVNIFRLFTRVTIIVVAILEVIRNALYFSENSHIRYADALDTFEKLVVLFPWLIVATSVACMAAIARQIPDRTFVRRSHYLCIFAGILTVMHLLYAFMLDELVPAQWELQDTPPSKSIQVIFLIILLSFLATQLIIMIWFERHIRRFSLMLKEVLQHHSDSRPQENELSLSIGGSQKTQKVPST